jgi:tRNA A37 methylthiotransferase MiaB
LDEARRLLEAGFREIVISGVNLRQYSDAGDDFWDFLSRLDADLASGWKGQATGKARLRVSSLEPGQLGTKALDALAACTMVAPHLHLSLQSGSASVLSRMGRGHYDPGLLPDFCAALNRIWPVFGLGADILTGFPGESEAEFAQTLELCEALPLSYAHVFPYSRRPGTLAATMPDQIAPQVKKSRARRLRALAREKQEHFLQSLLGLPRLQVVLEGRGHGVSEFYADCALPALDPALSLREIVAVRPVAVQKGRLVVEVI